MFAKHFLRKLSLLIAAFPILFLSSRVSAFDIDKASFKFIKRQYKRISEIKSKLDKIIEYQNTLNINLNTLNFRNRSEWFVRGIFGKKDLANVGKATVLIVDFYEDNFDKNLISNVAFNIFNRCLFKVSDKEKISKYELEALVDNLIILMNIENYKQTNGDIDNVEQKIVLRDDVKNCAINSWQNEACKVLNVRKEDITFSRNYVSENFGYLAGVSKQKLAYSSNSLKQNLREVLEEIEVLSDMIIGIINCW